MTVTLSSIQGWATEVQSALTALPTELQQAASSGGFAAVLAKVAATVDGGPAAVASSARAGTTGSARTASAATGAATGAATSPATGSLGGSWSATLRATGLLGGAQAVAPGGTGTLGQQVVAEARHFLGTPYVWGGESPQGFDCSGLVQYVYRHFGISLPRTTYTQVKVGAPVASLATARPGDLVFFAGSDGTSTSPGHVGIYLGGGKMIDAPYTGASVRIDTVGDPVAIRRVLPQTAAAVTASAVTTPVVSVAPAASAGSGAGFTVPSKLAPLFVAAAGKYGVPVTLLTAVAHHESRFETHAVSSAGAEGIMQIMPGTAAGLGITPFTAAQAIDGAARLLSGYLHQFGSVPLALAAYDAGAGAVEQYGGIPPYAETQAYVRTIMQTIGGTA